jgi:PLP dependent protein
VQSSLARACALSNRSRGDVTLVAVSKTHGLDAIRDVLKAGHSVFGENRVQEAALKFPQLRQDYPNLELHLIGPLQTNKAKEAVALFDVIQTLDRENLAVALSKEMKKQSRELPCFIQINTGREPQKAGVLPEDADAFIGRAITVYGLKIAGLMCIPPIDEEPHKHFSMLADIAKRHGLSGLSMGMSGDYEIAIKAGATHVRVGTAIFGARPTFQSPA